MMLRVLPMLVWFCLAACSAEQPPLVAENVVITRPIPGARMGAGYFTLRNTSRELIRIDKVSSPEFASIAMHESVLEDGMARMHELQEIVILPRQSIEFAAGGKHLMMQHAATTPEQVTLQFFSGAAMLLSVQVKVKD